MPLPRPDCSGVDDDVCCEHLWRVANHLLALVAEPLQDCMIGGSCYGPAIEAYVAFSDASTLCCDTLSVALDGIGATTGSAAGLQTGLQTSRILVTTKWRVRLLESCYPTLSDQGATPTPAEYHAVNKHLYGHGEMMLRSLQLAHEQKNLHPAGCTASALRGFVPMPVQGDCVGWEAQIEVVTEWRQFWT